MEPSELTGLLFQAPLAAVVILALLFTGVLVLGVTHRRALKELAFWRTLYLRKVEQGNQALELLERDGLE